MKGGTLLLLLAALVHQAPGSNGKPQVTMSPILNQIFSGDTFYLRCDVTTRGSAVKWFFNDKPQEQTSKSWKIEAASSKHSGSYQCESEGEKSDSLDIDVLGYTPSATLSIITGQPVVRSGGKVILLLMNEDGLHGWNCWVHRGDRTNMIKLKLDKSNVSIDIETKEHTVPETIYWCTDGSRDQRSNQIMVRTSDKPVLLEMYPLPAVTGESLTLRCLVWKEGQIQETVFYKDGTMLLKGSSETYEIPDVTESSRGMYKCNSAYSSGTPATLHKNMSDNQNVLVQESYVKAFISEKDGLLCSCATCPSQTFKYYWYYKEDDSQQWNLTDFREESISQPRDGTYACKAVWHNGRSFLSKGYVYPSPFKPVIVVVVVVTLIVTGFAAVALALCRRNKRVTPGPIYEDVGQLSRERGNEYEMLQKSLKAGKEGEYDTLHSETSGRQKGREYEALKKEKTESEVYHTLGQHEAGGGGGGYEALQKGKTEAEVYHTLAQQEAGGGGGGYEALQREGMKEGMYHSLNMEGPGGGETLGEP